MAVSPLSSNSQLLNQQTLASSSSDSSEKSVSKSIQQLSVELKSSSGEAGALDVQNQYLNLLYKTAIAEINGKLAGELGPNSLESAYEAGLDVSPEATADRIVSISLAFYSAFKAQHRGESDSNVVNNFIDTLRSGVKQGFAEAREILEGLSVLEGDIAENINRTYDLVMQGYDDFLEQRLLE